VSRRDVAKSEFSDKHRLGVKARRPWRGSRRRGQDAGSALLRDEAVHTAFLGHVVVSRLARFAQDSQSCDFTPVWIWGGAVTEAI
jgi:hypothetical protein